MSVKKQNKLKSYRDKMVETRQRSLDFFEGIDFRYENLGSLNGCTVINDSRSLDLEGTLESLTIINTPVHLILGDTDAQKLNDILGTEIRRKVVTLGMFGKNDITKRFDVLNLVDRAVYGKKMDEVVLQMIPWLKPGETLLFSPGSSNENFDDFIVSGTYFNSLVGPYINK
ncbi:MAG TPA: hypothetical protein VK177_05290 [Flavobacteriales bacterium]|nr:hypothetical protein [Flavobacteriales bacterium]